MNLIPYIIYSYRQASYYSSFQDFSFPKIQKIYLMYTKTQMHSILEIILILACDLDCWITCVCQTSIPELLHYVSTLTTYILIFNHYN